VALVTGAARGQRAAEGGTVIACDVHDRAEVDEGIVYRRLDVTLRDDWAPACVELRTEFGGLHFLGHDRCHPGRLPSLPPGLAGSGSGWLSRGRQFPSHSRPGAQAVAATN
jgi:NAD(P)-dependent dehydrogenase (short-subunit alcohol dehydrogenase family)